jgi:hypothetical protein
MNSLRAIKALEVAERNIKSLSNSLSIIRKVLEEESASTNTESQKCFNFECPALWFEYHCTSSKYKVCSDKFETLLAGS